MADNNNANVNVDGDNPSPEKHTIHNENWCCTKIRKIRCGYTWAIQNYKTACIINNDVLKSPTFSATNDTCKWLIKLYPKEDDSNMKIYLEAISYEEVEKYGSICGELKFSIINSERQETNTKKKFFRVDDEVIFAGFDDFISNDYLFVEENEALLVPQDKLTIYCEIIMVKQDDIVHVAGLCDTMPFEIYECDPLKGFGKLLNNSEFSDISIHVNGEEYPAHKSILAGRSRVFAAMLRHDMKENQLNRIDIKDVENSVFLEVLRFIYTGKVQNLEAIAFELLPVADRYDLHELKLMCENVLSCKLSRETVVKTLIFSDVHNVQNLKARTIDYIKANSIDILNAMDSESWNELTSRTDLVKDVLTAYMNKK